jgi:branched-chain amino acid transport system substrate-binding protein
LRKRLSIVTLLGVVGVLALVAAGCGGGGGGNDTTTGETSTTSGGGATALPASSCPGGIYKGSEDPQFIVASDLPLQGSGRTQTEQMVNAIKFIFKQQNFKAGKYTVGFQSCDDSTAQAGKWDSGKCSTNANSYATNKGVIGVIGTFNSGCAEIIIPILNRANPGPVGMVSPANTYVGLTHKGPAIAPGEPEKYYPNGKRNYTRIVAADDFQGAADALLTKQLGYKSVFILNDKEAYGLGVANDYQNSAKELGLKIAGFTAWDPKASSYEALATRIKQTGAETVFLGGLICENGAKLIKDLRSVLGAKYPLISPDGFSDFTANGPAAEDMYVSVAGIPPEKLSGPGKSFVDDFGAQIGTQVNPYAAYAAQAAVVMLQAIERSDGTRASVTDELFNTNIKDGILGSFSINENGDTTANPVTVYIQTGSGSSGTGKTYKTIVPPSNLVQAG